MSTIFIDSQADWEALIQDVAQSFENTPMRELLEAEVVEVEDETNERFSQQVASSGQPWAPLKPATIKRKGHARILVETGKLVSSLTRQGSEGAVVEIIDEPGQAGFTRGTSVEYAGYHQSGTRKMPARPPVGVTVQYVDGAAERVADYLVKQLKAGA